MNYNRTKNATKNIVFGLLSKIVLMIFPFVIKTIIIYTLGADYLGLNSLFTSLLTVLNLSELGISGAITYSMHQAYVKNDRQELNALLSFYKTLYRYIGLFILLMGLATTPFIERIIVTDTIPTDLNIHTIYLLYIFSTSISYWLFAYKTSILTVTQQDFVKTIIYTLVLIGQYVLQMIAIICYRNYYCFVMVQIIASVTNNLLIGFYTKKHYADWCAAGTLSIESKKAIFKKVSALIGHKIGSVIITSADNIVISAFLGLYILGQYNNYYTIFTLIIGFFAIVYNALLPSIANSIASESIEKNYRDFQTVTFLNTWLTASASICLLCLFQDFIILWVGESLLLSFPIVILLSINMYFWKMYDNISLYKDAAGVWNEDILRPYIASVFNLVVNIILVNTIGLAGVLISTILSMVLIHIPWMTLVFFKVYFKKSAKLYFLKQLTYALLTLAVGTLTYTVTNSIMLHGTLLAFVIKGIVAVLLPNAIFTLIFWKDSNFMRLKKILIVSCNRKLQRFLK